jgi:DNA mismatch repair protein MutS
VPQELIERARQILADVEEDAEDLAPRIARRSGRGGPGPDGPHQLGLFEAPRSEIEQELEKIDLDRLTPIEAMLLLRELKQKLR